MVAAHKRLIAVLAATGFAAASGCGITHDVSERSSCEHKPGYVQFKVGAGVAFACVERGGKEAEQAAISLVERIRARQHEPCPSGTVVVVDFRGAGSASCRKRA